MKNMIPKILYDNDEIKTSKKYNKIKTGFTQFGILNPKNHLILYQNFDFPYYLLIIFYHVYDISIK